MDKKHIGKLISKSFKQSGMNTVDLFKKTGITTQQFNNIVNAKSNYTIDTLFALIKELKLEVKITNLNNY